MSLTPFEETYCQGLEAKLDATIGTLQQAQTAISGPLAQATSLLNDFEGQFSSTLEQIDGGISNLVSAAADSIPDPPNVDNVMDMLSKCAGLQTAFTSGSPGGIADDFSKSVGDSIGSAIGDAFDVLESLVEFPIVRVMDTVNEILSNLNVPNLIGELDGFLDCLDSLCGSDTSSKIDQINNLMSSMKLTTDGILDRSTLFSVAGISQTKIDDLVNIGDSLTNVKSLAADNIESVSDALKSTVKAVKSNAIGTIIGKINIPFA